MDRIEQFRELHRQAEPLLIANAWNVQSARVFERLNLKAIATSSAAVAETLGYDDGQQMSFEEYLFVIKRIAESTTLPLSVDLEAGYANDGHGIANNIRQLIKVGVVGINIEDSVVADGKRQIRDIEQFTALLEDIVKILRSSGAKIFINVRTDVFLLGLENPVKQAAERIGSYESAGVDGLFFPCITQLEDVKVITKKATLPVNVMAMPGLPSFQDLQDAGVKRISMGNFLNRNVYGKLENQISRILTEQSFQCLF